MTWDGLDGHVTPVVTVVMPVLNAQPRLKDAVASIQAQSFSEWEFIIVDGGSTDGSLEVLQGMASDDRRIRVVERPEESLVDSLNRGVSMATGQFIARMDGDDLSHPLRLERQVAFLNENQDIGIVGSDVVVKTENGGSWVAEYPHEPVMIEWTMPQRCSFAHGAIMARSNVLKENPYRSEARYAEDFDLWARLVPHVKMANLGEPLFIRMDHAESISHRHMVAQKIVAIATVKEAFKRIYDKDLDDDMAALIGRQPPIGQRPVSKDVCDSTVSILVDCAQLFITRTGADRRLKRKIRRDTIDTAWHCGEWAGNPILALRNRRLRNWICADAAPVARRLIRRFAGKAIAIIRRRRTRPS